MYIITYLSTLYSITIILLPAGKLGRSNYTVILFSGFLYKCQNMFNILLKLMYSISRIIYV